MSRAIEGLLKGYEKAVKGGQRISFEQYVRQSTGEGIPKVNTRTRRFFNRSAEVVVRSFSEAIYSISAKGVEYSEGEAKEIVVPSGKKKGVYGVTLAEAYSEEDAIRVWQNARLERIRALQPGGVIAFRFRTAVLSFVKTRAGDNILIRELENVESNQRTKSATEVSEIFGLSHGQIGQLSVVGRNQFKFQGPRR